MIDIHCHILPGIDDGAETLEESVEMARIAATDGIKRLVATSHADAIYRLAPSARTRLLAKVNEAISGAGIDLTVLDGCEAFLDSEVAARFASGAYPRLGGSRYCLVEWHPGQPASFRERMTFALQVEACVPVFAHPERYPEVQANADFLVGYAARGILLQLNSGSLLGDFGPAAQRTAVELVERRLAHLLASDSHSSVGRVPRLSQAVEVAARLIGPDAARDLVEKTPAAIISDKVIEFPLPEPRRRSRHWWRLR